MFFLLLILHGAAWGAVTARPAEEDPLTSAQRQFRDDKLEAALATVTKLENAGDPKAAVLDLHGLILLEQGKFAEAIERFTAAHAQDPASFGQLHIGDALRREKKWAEARDAYRVAMKETSILVSNERLRYATLLTYLGENNENEAQNMLGQIPFPTESAAFYYAQAAWAFAHEKKSEAHKWLRRAAEIFRPETTRWFARTLYDFGWIKSKPPLTTD